MKRTLFLSALIILASYGILRSQESSEKFLKAEELIDNGLYIEASQLLTELCIEDDKNYEYFKELAYAYLNLFNYENAINNFSKAIELNPECIKCHSHIARAWYELGNYEMAESYLIKGFALSDTTAHLYMTRGLLYMKTDRNEQALQDFNTAITLIPDDPDFYIIRANYYIVNSEAYNAYGDISSAIKLEPENDEYYYYRAYILTNLNVHDEALLDIDKAISINNKYADYYNLKFTILMNSGNYDQAEQAVLKSIEIKPDDHFAYINLGDLYFQTSNFDSYCECYKKAIELHPDESSENKTNIINHHSRYCSKNRMPYYFVRTLGNFNNSNFGECISLCETGLDVSGTSSILYNVKASSHLSRFEYELAQADFYKSLENKNLLLAEVKDYYSYPLNDAEASRIAQSYIVKSNFGIAMTKLVLKEYDEALSEITKAIEMAESIDDFEDKEFLYITQGSIYIGKNDLENAKTNFETAKGINPNNLLSDLYLAMLSILKSGKYNTKKLTFAYVPEFLCPRLIMPAIKPNKSVNIEELNNAIKICNNIIELYPEFAYSYLLKSKLLQLTGDDEYCKYATQAKELGIFDAYNELNIECK
ncbi:MAG TPA: tetratricopeptide repeat protein [Bacteroidales bacterium]|nr:tetratricopeptide repeat protein [Bacteroidales bacterium]